MEATIARYFRGLAERFKSENRLSDLTWVMCYSSGYFQSLFLDFCFDTTVEADKLEREYSVGDSRPDFYFRDSSGQEYLIEIKIYDRGDHFEQYKKTFPNAQRAFLANYTEPEHEGWMVKTWAGFIRCLDEKTGKKPNELSDAEYSFIRGYSDYVKSVTYYWEAKSMNLSNISSLYTFSKLLSQIVAEFQIVKFTDRNLRRIFGNCYYGKDFYYLNNDQKPVCFWYGLFLPESGPGVYLSFPFQGSDMAPPKERKVIEALGSRDGRYFDPESCEEEEGDFFIRLKDEYFEKLCSNAIAVEEQKSILKGFLEEIIALLNKA
jgi:hypothetical protein